MLREKRDVGASPTSGIHYRSGSFTTVHLLDNITRREIRWVSLSIYGWAASLGLSCTSVSALHCWTTSLMRAAPGLGGGAALGRR